MIGSALSPLRFLFPLIPGTSQILDLNNALTYGMAWALAGIAGRLAAFAVLIGPLVASLGTILATSATGQMLGYRRHVRPGADHLDRRAIHIKRYLLRAADGFRVIARENQLRPETEESTADCGPVTKPS